jgi:hypothetical protein
MSTLLMPAEDYVLTEVFLFHVTFTSIQVMVGLSILSVLSLHT